MADDAFKRLLGLDGNGRADKGDLDGRIDFLYLLGETDVVVKTGLAGE